MCGLPRFNEFVSIDSFGGRVLVSSENRVFSVVSFN